MNTAASGNEFGAFKSGCVKAASAAALLLRLPVASLTGLEPDSWRRVVGLGLRSDGTKFGLSAFGLALFSNCSDQERHFPTREQAEAHFVKRWAEFIRAEPEARWVLHHQKHFVERQEGSGDLVVSRFSTDGELQKIEPWEDALPLEDQLKIAELFCAAHRATRALPEGSRPEALQQAAAELMMQTGESSWLKSRTAQRIRAGSQITFEMQPQTAERFFPPDFRFRRPVGCGVFNIVVRLAQDFRTADVWLQIHHVATDGAPVQEMLSRLEKSWGTSNIPAFPDDDPSRTPRLVSVQPAAMDRALFEVADFINFAPLLEWRDAINKRFIDHIGGSAPVIAVLMWHLARQKEFSGKKFSTAIDVPKAPPHARAVAMVGASTADYEPSVNGFAEFARDYLKDLEKARLRTSQGWALTRQIALLPPWLAVMALKADAARGQRIFGTVGISMLKDAKVFSAPMEDAGWYEGFMAIGNLSLQTQSQGTVAAVTARGSAETARAYPAAIRRAIQSCREKIQI